MFWKFIFGVRGGNPPHTIPMKRFVRVLYLRSHDGVAAGTEMVLEATVAKDLIEQEIVSMVETGTPPSNKSLVTKPHLVKKVSHGS